MADAFCRTAVMADANVRRSRASRAVAAAHDRLRGMGCVHLFGCAIVALSLLLGSAYSHNKECVGPHRPDPWELGAARSPLGGRALAIAALSTRVSVGMALLPRGARVDPHRRRPKHNALR